MTEKSPIGSSLTEFLKEQGMYDEVTDHAKLEAALHIAKKALQDIKIFLENE